jgi:hypothetical protein
MEKISIVLGTRHRPFNMERMCQSDYNTCFNPDYLDIIFYIDNDDDLSQNKFDYLREEYGDFVKCIVGPRICMSQMQNECAKISDANIFQTGGDDNVYESDNFDEQIREAFNKYPDRICLVGADDGANYDLFTHPFLHRNFLNVLGELVPSNYSGDYCDWALWDLFGKIDTQRRIAAPAIIRHMHYSIKDKNGNPLSTQDQVNREKNQRCYGGPVPCQVQVQLDNAKREQQANLLREFINGYK